MQEKLNCKPYGWIIEQRWSYKVGNGNGIYEERMINETTAYLFITLIR